MEQNGHRAGLSNVRNKQNIDDEQQHKSDDRNNRVNPTAVAIQLALLLLAFSVGVLGSIPAILSFIRWLLDH